MMMGHESYEKRERRERGRVKTMTKMNFKSITAIHEYLNAIGESIVSESEERICTDDGSCIRKTEIEYEPISGTFFIGERWIESRYDVDEENWFEML